MLTLFYWSATNSTTVLQEVDYVKDWYWLGKIRPR
jgi:hypothetical protein